MPYKDVEKRREYWRQYNKLNQEKRRRYARDYYSSHREMYLEYFHNYDKNNRDKINKYKRNKINSDLQFRLACNLRGRLRRALTKRYKAGSAIRDLGCSIEQLKSWLMYQFQPGMTWDNYGEWHIDHVKPLSSFDLTDREQLLEACNWYNLQPLWAWENLRKSDKYGALVPAAAG